MIKTMNLNGNGAIAALRNEFKGIVAGTNKTSASALLEKVRAKYNDPAEMFAAGVLAEEVKAYQRAKAPFGKMTPLENYSLC